MKEKSDRVRVSVQVSDPNLLKQIGDAMAHGLTRAGLMDQAVLTVEPEAGAAAMSDSLALMLLEPASFTIH